MCVHNLKVVAFPVPEIIVVEVLGGGCKLPILRIRKRPYRGRTVGDGTVQKSIAEFL